ncbi:MAG TPA: glycosyltransferase [Gemmata sp.]|nr:glycosyltransferase [Gemmata sp.]
MLVTVAMCTWNRAALLDQTLTRMRELRIPAGLTWELLIVNNNSTDNTDEVIDKHTANLPIRRLLEKKQGHSNARNCAIDHAQGELILWTDDDVDPDLGWLSAAVEAFARHPDAAAVGGPIEPWFAIDPDPDLMAAFRELRIGYCGVDHGPNERWLGVGEAIYGANMAFRRSLVTGLRFDPRTGRNGVILSNGDDTTYVAAVRNRGGKVLWAPPMRLRHYVDPHRMTLPYLERFNRDNARLEVLTTPGGPYSTIFGVPRWLIRQYAAAVARTWLFRLACRRQDRLRALREKWTLRGRIAGYRALAQEPA